MNTKKLILISLCMLLFVSSASAYWDPGDPNKWVQFPDLDWTGVDVSISYYYVPYYPYYYYGCGAPVGDDFQCITTGPILDIHLWCSWLFDQMPFWWDMPPGDPTAVSFLLSIYSNNPQGPYGYSEPNEWLWDWWFDPGDFDVRVYADQLSEWFYVPCLGLYGMDVDWTCWQYNFYIDPEFAFIQKGSPDEPVTYWLVVQAFPWDETTNIGWKTSLDHWMDDAVWGSEDMPNASGSNPLQFWRWYELRYPPEHPFHPESIDLAFVITGEEEVLDFGDLPDPTYPTFLASNGARHVIGGPWMGDPTDVPDPEPDGQPVPPAMGDDMDGNDDEDGLIIPTLTPGQAVTFNLEVNDAAGAGGVVEIWVDYNIDGDLDDAGELAYSGWLPVGIHAITINVPAAALPGMTFARGRISSLGTGSPRGQARDGEVEDTEVYIEEQPPMLDCGDAPEGSKANPVIAYPSLGVNGWFPTCMTCGTATWIQHGLGQAHFVMPGAPQPPWDPEFDGDAGLCPPPGAFPPYDVDECFMDGDAGLMFPEPFTINAAGNVVPCPTCNGTPLGRPCQLAVWGVNVDIWIVNNMPVDGFVNVLADWDQNGAWAGQSNCPLAATREHVLVNFLVPAGYIGPLSGLMPAGSSFLIGPNSGYIWTRFSITEQPVPTSKLGWDGSGIFEDGETEDYLLYVEPIVFEPKPLIEHSKWSQPPIEVDPNYEIPVYSGWDEVSFREWAEPNWFDCWNCRTQCYGDADCDGFVGPQDIIIIQDAIGHMYPDPLYNPCADCDRNLMVNNIDLTICLTNAGANPYPPPDCPLQPQLWLLVADDFRCLGSMPIISVHFWGSHFGWSYPGQLPPNLPIGWKITFWSNVAANPDVEPGYSYPLELLWQIYADADRVEVNEVGIDSYHDFYPEDICYQYTLHLEPEEYFWQAGFLDVTEDDIFWISIAAVYDPYELPEFPWGWKTRSWSWMDDAVRFWWDGPLEPGIVLDPYMVDPIIDPLYGESMDVAFELDTDPGYIKWEQYYTGIRHWEHYEDEWSMGYVEHWVEPITKWVQKPDITDYNGIDVDATADPIWKPQVLADDFPCELSGPIDRIHVWGSWYHDHPPYWDANNVVFTLSIHADIPATVSPTGYSMPGDLLWQRDFQRGEFQVFEYAYTEEGWYVPCADPPVYDPFADTICYLYMFPIHPPDEFIQKAGNIYWLDVQAKPMFWPDCPEPVRFGWKNTPLDFHWNDDAVWTVGEDPPPPYQWYELRYPIGHPYENWTVDLAFEIFTGGTKWCQPPDLQPGTSIDIDATKEEVWQPQLLADDFPCDETEPITDIHIWGSWYHDFMPYGDPRNVMFTLSIHEDLPIGDPANPNPYSMPGELLWMREFWPGEFDVSIYAQDLNEGWFVPCGEPPYYEPFADTVCWQYDFYINESEAFEQQEGNIYWLDVQAQPFTPAGAPVEPMRARFGWKTTPPEYHWNDDAVWAVGTEKEHGPWNELRYPLWHPYGERTADLAFAITADKEYEEFVIYRLVADDWPCQNRAPVTDIVLWGSYLGYQFEPCSGEFMPLPVQPDYFLLGIWTDTPANPGDPFSFSHPNDLIWEYKAYDYDEVLVGYDKHPEFVPTEPNGHEPVFRYSVRLPKDNWFTQEEPNDIYWLSVVAVYDQNVPNYDWGWTNHEHTFQDDAVAGYPDFSGPEPEWIWEELYDQTGMTEDMSFMLFTLCIGDVDKNGKVNKADITALAAYLVDNASAPFWTVPCPPCDMAADVDCNGKVNKADITALAACLVDHASAPFWTISCPGGCTCP